MAKKSHKQRKKVENILLIIKNLATTKINLVFAVSLERDSIRLSSFAEFIKLIRLNPKLRQNSFNPPFPESPKELEKVRPLFQTTLERELIWAATYLSLFSTQINDFLTLSLDFQKAFLLSNNEKCDEILSKIEDNLGFSLWLIRNKIAFLQTARGLEDQKAFANFIRGEAGGTTAIVTYFFSLINEVNVTPNKFLSAFSYHILDADLPEEYKSYLSFHITPDIELSLSDIHNTLSYEGVRNVVDYYETLISLCQIAVVSEHTKIFPSIIQVLKLLKADINDERIDSLLYELSNGETKFNFQHAQFDKVLGHFLKGDFLESYQLSKNTLVKFPYNFDLMEIMALSASLSNEESSSVDDSYLEKIITNLSSIIKRENEISENLASLLKTSMILSSFSWGRALASFYWKEKEFFTPQLTDKLQHSTTLGTTSFNPLRVSSIQNKKLRSSYFEDLREASTEVIVTNLCTALLNDELTTLPPELFKEQRNILIAENLIKEDAYDEALDFLEQILKTSYKPYRHQAIKLRAYCLLKLLRLEECLLLIASAYLEEPTLAHILPITDVVNTIDKNTRKKLINQISLPIVFDIYSKYYNNDKDAIKNYSYEDFLFANNIKRPSEFESIINNFDRAKIIYFLRYLCIESIMDGSTVFEGSRDVTEERLKVCRILVEIDPDSIEIYRSEIKTLLKRLMVQEKITEIEQSKIYVDVDGIKRKLEKTMKESFDRYISFLKNNISFKTESRVIEAVKLANQGDTDFLAKISLPQNEMNDIFELMIVEMRDEFISSNVHGLDGYLSLRIRHGTLEGQLRKPLEDSKLVTERESTTGSYKPNLYWTEYLNITDEKLKAKIIERLASFAQEFDELVQTIKNVWIQIRRNPEDKGLFDFVLLKVHIAYYAEFITPETTFEEFINYIFSAFFVILDDNLEIVRKTIDENAKSKVNKLLTSLQNDLEEYSPAVDLSDLSNKIVATRTEMLNVFNRIKEWFRLSSTTNNDPFIIDDAISISEEALRTTSHGLNVQLSNQEDLGLVFQGNRLSNIVDIFYIIFENIIRHSKLSGRPKADIAIKKQDRVAYIIIENEIGKDVLVEKAKERIEAIKSGMKEGKYMKSISKEGGTGFHKIWKILSHEFSSPATELDFGFMEDKRFFVKITLSFKTISYEDFSNRR